MPLIVSCPSCTRQLRVPEDLLGKLVKCPSCNETFMAEAQAEPVLEVADEPAPRSAPPPARPRDEEPVRSRRRPDDEFEDEDDDYDDRPRRRRRVRRDYAPHRGGAILTLAIVGFFCFGFILGPIAWVMGNTDMREIREGRMDPDGEGLTRAGQIIGIIVTCLSIFGCLFYGVLIMSGMVGGGRRRF